VKLQRSAAAREQRLSQLLLPQTHANPNSPTIKGLEMAVRRSASLGALMGLYTVRVGAEYARLHPPTRIWPEEEKLLVDVFDKFWWRQPEIRCGWTFLWDSWACGAGERQAKITMAMMPDVALQRIAKEVAKHEHQD